MNQEDRSKAEVLNDLARICHEANKKWWLDLDSSCPTCGGGGVAFGSTCRECFGTGHPQKERNFGELIALCHSELSEALEGHRKNKMDSHLPNRKNVEVELADLLIRVFDLCGGLGFDIAGALIDKTDYNAHREDHKIENRKAQGGKAY